MVDYDNGVIYLGTVGTGSTPGNISVIDANPERRTVMVSYSWQNNAGTVNSTTGQIAGATARASYETGNKIAVSIGMRLYDPAIAHPTYFSLSNAVSVGNASH
jgi:hypothetical protein